MKKICKYIVGFILTFLIGMGITATLCPNTNFVQTVAEGEQEYPVDPVHTFSTETNFAGGTITVDDEYVDLIAAAYCGVTYKYYGFGSYGYKAIISSTTAAGGNKVFFCIGDTTDKVGTDADFTNFRGGYEIIWSGWGTSLTLIKTGTIIKEFTIEGLAFVAYKKYLVEIDMVDEGDNGTRILFKVNDETKLDYLDKDNPLKPQAQRGYLENTIWTVWNQLTLYKTGYDDSSSQTIDYGETDYPIEVLNSYSTPKNFAFGNTQIKDDTVELDANAYCGVTYSYKRAGSYAYQTQISSSKPLEGGSIHFSIADTVEKTNSWVDFNNNGGYQVTWDAYGTTLTLTKGVSEFLTSVDGLSFAVNTKYDIEFHVIAIDESTIRVIFKIDGVEKINYLDTNNPLMPISKEGFLDNTIWTIWQPLTVYDLDYEGKPQIENLGVLRDEIGTPTLIPKSQTVDLNGRVRFDDGVIVYPKSTLNVFYNFEVNFIQINEGASSALVIMLNYNGTPDIPSGPGWKNKGYALYLYPNGMRELRKGGATIITPDWYGIPLTTGNTYSVKAGSYVTEDNTVKILCYVNNRCIFDFEDTVKPITTKGLFGVWCDRCAGQLSPLDCPTITLQNVPEYMFVGDEVELDYVEKNEGDEVTYYVDTVKSTAKGSFVGNKLKVERNGLLYVYAKVNQYYSTVECIECYKTGVFFDNLPSEYIIGSGPLHVSARLYAVKEAKTMTYSIVEGNEFATIDSNGNLTALSIGKIRIKATATCEDGEVFESGEDEGILKIVPSISLTLNEIDVGQEIELKPTINVENKNSDIFDFEIVQGERYAKVNNGKLYGDKTGYAVIKVTFAKGKDYETSKEFGVNVIGVKLTLPASPIIYGNGDGKVSARYSDGHEAQKIQYFVENGTGSAMIDENTGDIHYISAGSVYVYAVLDGISESPRTTLIINPKIELANTIGMAVGAERDLSYYANCPLPTNEEIIVTYEILDEIGMDKEPADIVDLDPITGHIKAKAIGKFTVRVNVVGETFEGITLIDGTTIGIENPIVTVTKVVEDMFIGQTQEIQYTYGNNEIEGPFNASIVIAEGADLVKTDGVKITALAEGTVCFRVKVNGTLGAYKYLVISEFDAALLLEDTMEADDYQTLDYIVNSYSYVPEKVEYTIISGAELATIEDGKLVSGKRPGNVTLRLTLDDTFTLTKTIHIDKDFYVYGVFDKQEVYVNKEYVLSVLDPSDIILNDYSLAIESGEATLNNKNGVYTLTNIGYGEIILAVSYQGNVVERLKLIGANPALDSVVIKQEPTKLSYFVGEELKLDGLVVQAEYTDHSSRIIDNYTVSGFSSTKAGKVAVTVSFEGKSTTFEVTINEIVVDSIVVTAKPTKTTYKVGDSLDLSGLVITGNYNNGTSKVINDYSVSGFDSTKVGKVTVNVEYEGKTTSFEVTISEVVLESIVITANPAKTTYKVGENLDLTGLVVTARYSDGSSKVINDFSVSGFSSTNTGEVTVTIHYEGKTTSFVTTIEEVQRGCGGSVVASSALLASLSLIALALIGIKKIRILKKKEN